MLCQIEIQLQVHIKILSSTKDEDLVNTWAPSSDFVPDWSVNDFPTAES